MFRPILSFVFVFFFCREVVQWPPGRGWTLVWGWDLLYPNQMNALVWCIIQSHRAQMGRHEHYVLNSRWIIRFVIIASQALSRVFHCYLCLLPPVPSCGIGNKKAPDFPPFLSPIQHSVAFSQSAHLGAWNAPERFPGRTPPTRGFGCRLVFRLSDVWMANKCNPARKACVVEHETCHGHNPTPCGGVDETRSILWMPISAIHMSSRTSAFSVDFGLRCVNFRTAGCFGLNTRLNIFLHL